MAHINDQRNKLRIDLLKAADLIAALRSKAAINDRDALNEMSKAAAELQQKAHALVHLLETEPEVIRVQVPTPPVQLPTMDQPKDLQAEIPSKEIHVVIPEKEQINSPPEVKNNKFDLRPGIGLNEKLMLVKNLFSGDNRAYDTVIDRLNSSQSKNEALHTAKMIAAEKNWKQDGEAFAVLLSVINRRMA